MSRRRLERSGSKATAGKIPKVLLEYPETGGFWDSRADVEKWCERERLGCPPDSYFRHPPGLRQWCIDAWARREGFVNKWGNVNGQKLKDLGIWRGYGRGYILARHSEFFTYQALNDWRPISAPYSNVP